MVAVAWSSGRNSILHWDLGVIVAVESENLLQNYIDLET